MADRDEEMEAIRRALREANEQAKCLRLALKALRNEVADCPYGHH